MDTILDLNGKWNYQGKTAGWMQIPCPVEIVEAERDHFGEIRMTKEFEIPVLKKECRYIVRFQGVSYWCRVLCNGQKVTEHEGIWDAFSADITENITEGKNRLEVVLIKPNFDKDSEYYFRSVLFGFIPDVMLPFGGIWRDVTLEVTGNSYFEHIRTVFDREHKEIVLSADVRAKDRDSWHLVMELMAPDGTVMKFEGAKGASELRGYLEDPVIWEPEAPAIYKGTIYLTDEKGISDEKRFSGGFRKTEIRNGQFIINGKPFYMRGILHWGCYPGKMVPNPSYEEVKEELLKLKELGFNTVKHCLYFPPEYYYELCDELGFVTWQELPLWLPYKNRWLMERIFSQYPKMLDLFLHHPTVILTSLGCELDATIDTETLNSLYQMIKKQAPEMIICDNSGSGECFEGQNDSDSDIYDYHFYAELYNLNELIQEFTAGYRKTKPWVFGEFNDSDTFRIGKESEKPWWREADERKNLLRLVHKGFGSDQPVYYQKEILEKYGVLDELEDLERLSIEQMKEIRKFILETTRSFPEIQGYNITTIQDVPITTAGIFDDDMRSKVESEWMQQINGPVTVSFQKDLSRQWKYGSDHFLNRDRYNYFSGEKIRGRLVLSNMGNVDLNGICKVKLEDRKRGICICSAENIFESGQNTVCELPQPSFFMPETDLPGRLTFCVELTWGSEIYRNEWDLWVYPKLVKIPECYVFDPRCIFEQIEEELPCTILQEHGEIAELKAGDVLVSSCWTDDIRKAFEQGIKVICFVQPGQSELTEAVPFYREGIIKMMQHEAVSDICHKGYCGIQFFGIAPQHALKKLVLDEKYPGYQSLIRRYDARKFFVNDYAVLCRKGENCMILSTLNLAGGHGEQPSGFRENRLGVKLLSDWIRYIKDEDGIYE